ncbi:MAG: HD domain-containing protein [Myxococcota bacterium]
MTERAATVELRDPLHGPIPVSHDELRVIDAPHFQRLRRVKQLGFAEFAFPGAVHNRFLHSIGAMHLAGRLFDEVAPALEGVGEADLERLRQTVRLAALLHDIGHPPLSHAAEALLPERTALGVPGREGQSGRASHEDITLKLILDSGLTRVLGDVFGTRGITPAHVAALIEDDVEVPRDVFTLGGLDHRPLLHAMVSGELDVDRMDYLLRDSTFAGVGYGRYDLHWLLSEGLAVRDGDAVRLGISMRAVPAFEHFLLARYHMFRMVYFHPKSDIYDAMLREWLASVGDEARFPADPEAYVGCDDAWLLDRLRRSEDSWARRVVERRPLGLVAELREPVDPAWKETFLETLRGEGVAPIWLTAKPVLSRYARSPAHLRTNPLLVREDRPGRRTPKLRRIEEVTDLFDRYERTLEIERLYVAKEAREDVGRRLEEALEAR